MYPQVFGKYVLERELARGGMARVMLATLRGAGGFEKKLVVKQIRDELACDDAFVARFVEEAKTAVSLAHPNIVPVYELGVELGTYFLAMELVEGASLSELLRSSALRGLSPEEGAYVGVEVCSALDYAHRRMNVVHRDITPRNVMIDEEGHVKVIDFGIAAPVATSPGGHGVFGSPGHMPPEQIDGRELTAAADVFAVAALLMEAWSGSPPFRRKTNEGVLEAMHAPHPKPSDVNIRLLPLDDVIASALSLDAKARPQQADDLGRVLRRFLAGIDLGDLAHQIGDRVRAVRASPPPARERDSVLQRPPSRPTGTQVGTKTFAAREEVRKIVSGGDIATRRMASAAPEASTSAANQSWELATAERENSTRRALTRRPIAWALAGAAGVLAAFAFSLGRGAIHTPPMAKADPTPSVAPAPQSLTADLPAVPEPVAPATAKLPDPERAPATTAAPVERARLLLLGDGTLVQVDGVPYGPCPAHAAIDPGAHAVLFTFPATGESKSTTLSLRAGERATLRADFTGAVPRVRIER